MAKMWCPILGTNEFGYANLPHQDENDLVKEVGANMSTWKLTQKLLKSSINILPQFYGSWIMDKKGW